MIELNSPDFHKVSSIFHSIDHHIAVVYAVIEQNSPGRIFVDDLPTPAVALLYAEGAFFYIGGDENQAALDRALVPLIFNDILPHAAEPELVLFSFSTAWREKLDSLLSEKGVLKIHRKVFKFCPERFTVHRNWKSSLPEGFSLRAIDGQLAEQYPVYQPIVDPQSKRFGVCLMQADKVVSECHAIFVGGGEAEIDIHTQAAYQGRGFAKLTASAFIETCLSRGLTPNWSCWPERLASWSLAKTLGFEEQPDVPAHYWAEDMS